MTCNVSVFRCDSKEQPRDRTLETSVFVCVVLSCSLGNRQQQEKKSLGIIGQRFYPLWPIKPQLRTYKQPIRDLMPSWGGELVLVTHTHNLYNTLGEISYTFTHISECLQWWEGWSRMVQRSEWCIGSEYVRFPPALCRTRSLSREPKSLFVNRPTFPLI